MLSVLKDKKYQVLETVSSTNDYIKDKDLYLVIAKEQTGGKGTNNRSFFSPSGGIYLSVKLPLNLSGNDFLFLTPLVAVITANAIDKVAGVKTEIKWVNDLYLNGKKLGGILCESKIVKDKTEVIIGVGINVKSQNFPPFLKNTPTSLESETGQIIDNNRLIAELLTGFESFEERLKARDFFTEYRDRFFLTDREVSIEFNGETFIGKATGVDDNLGLKVEINGEIKTFINGCVSIKY
ncbi:MAG: biotin--[Clostridia bacterium]|nr:biotin--[acetyl-CoA-carboxylase] ligase [Clostridia bacterium]